MTDNHIEKALRFSQALDDFIYDYQEENDICASELISPFLAKACYITICISKDISEKKGNTAVREFNDTMTKLIKFITDFKKFGETVLTELDLKDMEKTK